MKKTIFVLLSLFASTVVVAQDLHLELGTDVKTSFEIFKPYEKGMFFNQTEVNFSENQAVGFWSQTFCERYFGQFVLHGEYRTLAMCNNDYIVAVGWLLPFGTIIAGVDVNSNCNWFSNFVWGCQVKKFSFEGTEEIIGRDYISLCTENKVFYNLYKNLSLGAEMEIGYNFRNADDWNFNPYVVLKCGF